VSVGGGGPVNLVLLGVTLNSGALVPIWNCLHLFSGLDGTSRVDSIFTKELSAFDFAPPAPPMFVARVSDAQALAFVELPVGWKGGWHASPKKQWVICLAGEMGYEAGMVRSSRCVRAHTS
jgi:hypothetical protein